MDNLNPDFLYPELSKQTLLFTELMQSLSRHLKPAPYPYGLLTLRLLGKLGGKNRRFLREPIDVCDQRKIDEVRHALAIECQWVHPQVSRDQSKDGNLSSKFALPLPLERCLEILKLLAMTESPFLDETRDELKKKGPNEEGTRPCDKKTFPWTEYSRLWTYDVEDVDFNSYRLIVKEETERTQAEAAFRVIRAALAACLGSDSVEMCNYEVIDAHEEKSEKDESDTDMTLEGLSFVTEDVLCRNADFLRIALGLMNACLIEATKDEANLLLKGFATKIYFLVLSHHMSFSRIDANGSRIPGHLFGVTDSGESAPPEHEEGSSVTSEQLGSLKPFGFFHHTGVLEGRVDPLEFNRAVAEFLTSTSSQAVAVGLEVLNGLIRYSKRPTRKAPEDAANTEGSSDSKSSASRMHRGSLIFFENLLSHLCMNCFSKEWNMRNGLQEGICLLIEGLGCDWGLRYESEIMNVAFFVVKNVPRELSTAVVEAFRFFVRICCGLYGRPRSMHSSEEDKFVWDSLAVTGERSPKKNVPEQSGVESDIKVRCPSTAILQVLLSEMASSKQIVR